MKSLLLIVSVPPLANDGKTIALNSGDMTVSYANIQRDNAFGVFKISFYTVDSIV